MRRAPAARPLVALLLATALAACGARGPAQTPDTPPPTAAAPASASPPPTTTPLSSADETAIAQAGDAPPPTTTAYSSADEAAIATAVAATVAAMGGTAVAIAPGGLATRTPVVGMPQVLPAPIYVLDSGQVLRIERDAANYRPITFEPQPVVELAVPAEAGAIFYLTGDPRSDERTLVTLSGAGRRELLYGKLSSLAVSPDGRRAFVRVERPEPGLIIGQDESPSGVWGTTPDGGRPGLVIADEPADGVYDGTGPAWTYSPIAVSPDGSRLAGYAYDADGPAIPGGEIVISGPGDKPVRSPTCCEEPAWSADGAVLHTAGGGPGPDVRYGLYVTDAATGDERPVLEPDDDQIPLVTAPRRLADGRLYAFVELAPSTGFSWEHPFRPALSRVEPDGSVTPLAPPAPAPYEVLWSANGSGAVLSAPDGQLESRIYWQPADGQPAMWTSFTGADLAWVPANTSLDDGACDAFSPVGYQPASQRQFDPAAFDVQGRLGPLGFDTGAADGLYGEQTRAAVQAFQQSRGLPATGKVDCATWQAMLAQP